MIMKLVIEILVMFALYYIFVKALLVEEHV
jgi:hypothetical protein